jgi:hypothetical protein
MVISVTTLSVQPDWSANCAIFGGLWRLTNAKGLVVVAENGPRDSQEGRVLSAVNEAITTLLKVNVVNPDVLAGVL